MIAAGHASMVGILLRACVWHPRHNRGPRRAANANSTMVTSLRQLCALTDSGRCVFICHSFPLSIEFPHAR
jgi:hypothetical protein